LRVGLEGEHIADVHRRGAIGALEFARDHALDGVSFKRVLDLSPTLDRAELRDVRDFATAHDLYLEAGLGRVNPYNTAETPRIRDLGDGDYARGVQRVVEAARSIDCTELWAETGGRKFDLPGFFCFDRFRSDAPWQEQLTATQAFLRRLAPMLRDQGCRLNLETHEEITSFEVVRLVEAVGPDVVGITFDTGNVLARGEDPLAAARRVAPYTHLTHIKDAILFFTDYGLDRQVRACGDGVIDWTVLVDILAAHDPHLRLSLEDTKRLMPIHIFDARWLATHPDLNVAELTSLVGLAVSCERRIRTGAIPPPAAYQALNYELQQLENMQRSRDHLRGVVAQLQRVHSEARGQLPDTSG
jgi:sugar phosphate isomerase/epimerase